MIAELKLDGHASRIAGAAPVGRGARRHRRRSWRAACTGRTGDGRQVFQLHPAPGASPPGHVAKLELLGRDAPYGRASNGTFAVDVRSLELRLPVRERRGAQVRRPLAPVPGR